MSSVALGPSHSLTEQSGNMDSAGIQGWRLNAEGTLIRQLPMIFS